MDKIAKAIVAAVVAAYGIYEFATTAKSAGGVAVTGDEWVRTLVSGFVAGVFTWAVPNTTPDKLPPLPSLGRDDSSDLVP